MGAILVDRELRDLIGTAIRPVPGAPAVRTRDVQPASLDLRLGPSAFRIRAGFLPERVPIEDRLKELSTSELSLAGDGAVLERGLIYLIPLEEELELPAHLFARFNPRSSTGRSDLFTRVLLSGHPRFDETPRGYRGRLWLEVAPLSFPVRLRRGDRLAQLRLQEGNAALGPDELAEVYERTPLCFDGQRAMELGEVRNDYEGALDHRIGIEDRPRGGRPAHLHPDVVGDSDDGDQEKIEGW
jgi:dCTP deaminase